MKRLTRDGTAEPVSQDQIIGHLRGHPKGMFIFPVQLTTSRIGNLTRLIHTLLYVMTIHTYIDTYCSLVALLLLFSSLVAFQLLILQMTRCMVDCIYQAKLIIDRPPTALLQHKKVELWALQRLETIT